MTDQKTILEAFEAVIRADATRGLVADHLLLKLESFDPTNPEFRDRTIDREWQCFRSGWSTRDASQREALMWMEERLQAKPADDLVKACVQSLLDSGAENYLEQHFEFTVEGEDDARPVTVTVQFKDRPSPHQLRIKAEDEAERLRMQLAACGVGALSNTRESAARQRQMHSDYMSPSCRDVMRAVDSEMDLREALARVEAERDIAIAQMQNIRKNRDRLNKEQCDTEFKLCIAHQQLAEAVGLLNWLKTELDDFPSLIRVIDKVLARHAQAEQQEAQGAQAGDEHQGRYWAFRNEDGELCITNRWDVAKHVPFDVITLVERAAPPVVSEAVAWRYRCTDVEGNLLPKWYYSEDAGTLGLREPLFTSARRDEAMKPSLWAELNEDGFVTDHTQDRGLAEVWIEQGRQVTAYTVVRGQIGERGDA